MIDGPGGSRSRRACPDGRGPEVAIPPAPVVARKDGIPAALLVAPGRSRLRGCPPGGRELRWRSRTAWTPGSTAWVRRMSAARPRGSLARLSRLQTRSPGTSRPGSGSTAAARPWRTRPQETEAPTACGPADPDPGQVEGQVGEPQDRAVLAGRWGVAGRSRSGELGSSPGCSTPPAGSILSQLGRAAAALSSRGTLKRSPRILVVPPGRHDGLRRLPAAPRGCRALLPATPTAGLSRTTSAGYQRAALAAV